MKEDRPYMLRKIGKRVTRKFVVIVCEGSKTEMQYFQGFNERNSGVKVEPLHGKCTDAKNIVAFAERQIERYDLDFDDGDSLWCAFDVDQKGKQEVNDAVAHASAKNILIALSNPCIELWFLLHYKKIPSQISRKDAYDELKKFIRDYDKNSNIFPILKDKIRAAMTNAESLNQGHQRNGVLLLSVDSNPSTQVFKLVKNIQDLIKKNKKT